MLAMDLSGNVINFEVYLIPLTLICRPLAIIMQAQTSTDESEILMCLLMLKSGSAGMNIASF